MALNIKTLETYRLAKELADLTGESIDEAIVRALHERLARLRGQQEGRLSDQLLAIGRNCAARMKEPYRSIDHGDFLYGEQDDSSS